MPLLTCKDLSVFVNEIDAPAPGFADIHEGKERRVLVEAAASGLRCGQELRAARPGLAVLRVQDPAEEGEDAVERRARCRGRKLA